MAKSSQFTNFNNLTQMEEPINSDEAIEIIRQRYLSNIIYTNIEPSVLLALNPYSQGHHNSKPEYLAEYKDTSSAKANQWRSPHLYQMINHAYLHMRRTSINQSILFSGESGSGKSEQLKLSIDYLLTLGTCKKTTRIQADILHAQNIIYSFSHAKTMQHDNASRVALYIELQFSERGRITGAKFLPYALERSRVSSASQNERNFHIFYSLLAGASQEEKNDLGISDWTSFRYLARTSTSKAASLDDLASDREIRAALRSFVYEKQMIKQIYQVLAAILHLGNLQFIKDPNDSQDAAVIENVEPLNRAAGLLGVDANGLLSALTFKSKLIKRDITTLFLSSEQANKQRDDLAQSLYGLLFTWLTEQINDHLMPKSLHSFISLVDSPGWTFSKSSGTDFDQLTFHYMQEAWHHFSMSSMFEPNEQNPNNQEMSQSYLSSKAGVISLFTHPSKGLWPIMNAQATRQQSYSDDDHTLIENYASANNSAMQEQLLSFKKSETGLKLFAIQHFWGSVTYNAHKFTERNQDYLCNDFISLFRGSAYSCATSNRLVSHLFSEQLLGQDNGTGNRVYSKQQAVLPLHSPTHTRVSKPISSNSFPQNALRSSVPTITELVIDGMEDLLQAVSNTVTWSVICLRPNELSLPNSCDVKKLLQQYNAYKLSKIITRMKQGYYTMSFDLDEFWERYHASISTTVNNTIDLNLSMQERCALVTDLMSWNETWMTVDESKVYLSNSAFRILEDDLRSQEKTRPKKSKAPSGGPKSFDEFSVNDDVMSSVVPEDDYMYDTGVNDLKSTARYSQSVFEDRKSNTSDHLQYTSQTTLAEKDKSSDDLEEEPKLSGVRRKWLLFVWFLTWWVPSPALSRCGGLKRSDVRLAWREKVALCILIFLLSAAMVVFIIFFGPLVCPHQDVFSLPELQQKSEKSSAYVAIRGEVFDLTKFAPHHWATEVIPDSAVYEYGGRDATNLFPVQVSALCDGTTGRVPEEVVLDFQINLTDVNAAYHDFRFFTNDYRPDWYFEQMVYLRKNYRLGFMGYEPSDILHQATNERNPGDSGTTAHRNWAILHGDVYDLTNYLMGGRMPRVPKGMPTPTNVDLNFMDNSIVQLFRQLAGTDISKHFDVLPISEELRRRQLVCLRNLFFVGKVDTRRSIQCRFSEYFLLLITGFLCAVIFFKFLAALQMGSSREPEDYDKFVVCQVPCYTENEESLRKTIDSIAVLRYDDKRKLLFLVCDGMVTGSGNDKPTPRIVLDILGVNADVDPEPLSFLSLGDGLKQHNMSKIYSGLYECCGHVVPYVVVVKVGAPREHPKPGNRGKRDSQMVLMRFLNKVHFESPMTPMELEIYHQIKNVIGVSPDFYEFVLMVDADTEVLPESLNRMVSCFVHDSKIIGLCGETKLANEKDSWVTMIQVYEYYISHFLSKAFESLFGSVTCLPGCFCMYRVRSPGGKKQPLLVSNQVIDDYAVNQVDTLHQKNLLHLGEDRYLTTLILKHFPTHKTKFTSDAGCLTNAPDTWSVLLSQRRRWINSTIHNLGELVFLPQLCGFCCFSMRFVVILDLLSTLVMPAVVCYLGFLIYKLATDAGQVPFISILTLCGVYGLQALIFIIRRKWEHIGWMIIYILAIPLFSFFIPVYAFWHFDDFSWGNTRLVMGEDGEKKALPGDEGKFNPKSIPLKKWCDHENELWESGSIESKGTTIISSTTRQSTPISNNGYMNASNLNHLPMSHSGFYNGDNASFHYSSQNLTALNQPSVFNMPINLMAPASVYSEGIGYPMDYSSMMENIHQPTDEEIRREVQRITLTADLMTMTKKQVREQLSRHFGVNMANRKDFISHCIEESLRNQ